MTTARDLIFFALLFIGCVAIDQHQYDTYMENENDRQNTLSESI